MSALTLVLVLAIAISLILGLWRGPMTPFYVVVALVLILMLMGPVA